MMKIKYSQYCTNICYQICLDEIICWGKDSLNLYIVLVGYTIVFSKQRITNLEAVIAFLRIVKGNSFDPEAIKRFERIDADEYFEMTKMYEKYVGD